MPRATITLHEPVQTGSGFVSTLTFRPVWCSALCDFGSPFSGVPLDGLLLPHVDRKKLAFWATRLLVDCPDSTALDRTTDPRDHLAIEAALRGFFEPPAAPAQITTTSSSVPALPQTTSIV